MRRASAYRVLLALAVGLGIAQTTGRLLRAAENDNPPEMLTAQATAQPAARLAADDAAPPSTTPAAVDAAPVDEDPGRTAARKRLLSGLIGSKHDFSGNGTIGPGLCLPCHTPHLANAPTPEFDQRPDAVAPLRPYQALDAELDGWSLLCLGCHDGVTAPDVYSSGHAIQVAGQMGDTRLGAKGLRSHPVGIKYPAGEADYQPASAVEAKGLLLPGGRIQCGTCHDAHNTHGHAGMLKISNQRSQMCLTCHRL